MTAGERRRLEEVIVQAERDLDELAGQVEAGEIGPGLATRLRATYELERQEAADRLASLGADDEEAASPSRRSRGRMAAGGLLLVLALAVAVGLVGRLAEDRDDGTLQGVAAGEEFDPDAYSNETLEAVIASYRDDPTVAGRLPFMRFALAERYFEAGDFQAAFPHYEAIIESDPPPSLAAAALTRVAWIVWLGNGEAELALGLLDRALELVPGQADATYVKGQVLWCGLGDAAAAVPLFEQVAADPELDPGVAEQVRSDLEAARAGEPCG